MKACLVLLLFVPFLLIRHSWPQTDLGSNSGPAASAERKIRHLEQNGALAKPDPTPTELTEQEINSYFSSGNVELPAGVRSVVLQEKPGVVTGTSKVDFDQIKAGKNSYNPLLSIFSGLHDVVVSAHASSAHGQGQVHVDSVSIDGVEVPSFVLQLFVEKYLKPKYPNVGIDSQFALPARIDAATVGLHKVSLTQR